MGGGVEYWIGLPAKELGNYMIELVDQLEAEKEAMDEASKRRG